MTAMEIKILLYQNESSPTKIAKQERVSCAAVSRVMSGVTVSRRIRAAISKQVKKPISNLWPEGDRHAA